MTTPNGNPAVFCMSITPFAEDGSLDESRLRRHLRFVTSEGAGVYLCSQGSGEGHLLTEDERRRVYEIGADEINHVPVHAAGVGLGDTLRTVALARAAAAAGVDAIQILPPVVGPRPPRRTELEGYYRAVLEAVDVPVFISHNVYLGYGLDLDLLSRLATDYPHVAGVHYSDPDVTGLLRLLRVLGERLEIRVGMVPHLVTNAAAGGDGMLCFEPNVAPGLVPELWETLRTGGDATVPLRTLLRLHELLLRSGNPRSLKAALELLGHDPGVLRAPYLPIDDDERAELHDGLAALGLTRSATNV